jgi:hypothetical protein
MDEFKRHIKGWRKGGQTCPCCVQLADKQKTRRLARRRLRQADQAAQEVSTPGAPIDTSC